MQEKEQQREREREQRGRGGMKKKLRRQPEAEPQAEKRKRGEREGSKREGVPEEEAAESRAHTLVPLEQQSRCLFLLYSFQMQGTPQQRKIPFSSRARALLGRQAAGKLLFSLVF